MLDIQKWNWKTHEYEPYQPDPSWVIVIYSQDMDLAINCASCGKPMTYGEGYTSRELHTHIGFGYPVCETCYTAEFERDKASRGKDA